MDLFFLLSQNHLLQLPKLLCERLQIGLGFGAGWVRVVVARVAIRVAVVDTIRAEVKSKQIGSTSLGLAGLGLGLGLGENSTLSDPGIELG